jgi:hypothetical protein
MQTKSFTFTVEISFPCIQIFNDRGFREILNDDSEDETEVLGRGRNIHEAFRNAVQEFRAGVRVLRVVAVEGRAVGKLLTGARK